MSLARILKLEDFIVGTNNRIAHTAALEMVKERLSPFNPLFIHGTVGVGKTHLLQGVWNYIKEEMDINAVYMPAEKWTNEFIYSLQKGKMEAFRQKYRNVDVLFIDDVHFFSNKQGVQEELLHTFNALYDLSKKIIFASDAHPKMIGHIKENLASRFMSGMVVKMDKPDFTTRLLILRSKAAKFEMCFSEEVLEFIAEKHGNSVREIESMLTTLSAHARFNEKKLDLHLVNEVLADFPHDEGRIIKIEAVEGAILNYYNISRNELHSTKKIKSVSFPRQVCMYLIKTLMDWSYQQIGDYFSNKKHTTVMFAIKKIKEQIDCDKQFRVFIEMLIERIKKRRNNEIGMFCLSELKKKLKEDGVDGFLVTSEVNIRYVTNFTGNESILLITPGHDYLFTDFRYAEQAQQDVPWAKIVVRKVSLMKTICGRLKRLNVRRLYVESSHLTFSQYSEIKEYIKELN